MLKKNLLASFDEAASEDAPGQFAISGAVVLHSIHVYVSRNIILKTT